jgi:hypothetical protein
MAIHRRCPWRAVASASHDALERRPSPREREVADHRSRRTYTGRFHRHRSESKHRLPPKNKTPAPPSPGRQHGGNAHRTSAKARARRGQQLDDETPWSAANGVDSHHPQTPIRQNTTPSSPVGKPSSPTLYTRRETGFPRPTAAGAAGGERESPRLSACKVDRPVVYKSPSKHCRRGRGGPGSSVFYYPVYVWPLWLSL